jgi:hypothetical protein
VERAPLSGLASDGTRAHSTLDHYVLGNIEPMLSVELFNVNTSCLGLLHRDLHDRADRDGGIRKAPVHRVSSVWNRGS